MDRIRFHYVFCLLFFVGCEFTAHAQEQNPNVIFIFADDWGYGDLSLHGSTWIETPNIDKMASEGIDFSNFTVNSPVCSPSRVAVMTGQFPARQSIHQHFQNIKAHQNRGMPDWMDADGLSLPREFQKAGYVTGHFGKWHLGKASDMPNESAYGYDEYATFNGSGTIQIPKDGSLAVTYAEDFIKKHSEQPFFINLWLHEAHLAHFPKDRFMDKFKDLGEQEQVYASIIAEGDEVVGRIMSLLKELGLDDNTLVVFSTDNGPEWEGTEEHKTHKGKGYGSYYSVGETGGLKGQKRSLFAGGVRVPFIAKWPKVIPQGVVNETAVITAVDLVPTFFEAAGIDMPSNYESDGQSFMSALKGKEFERSKPIYWEWKGGKGQAYTWPSLGVRDGDWKLVRDAQSNRSELYNVKEDWKEEVDVSDSNPNKVNELLAKLNNWKKSLPSSPRESCTSSTRNRKKSLTYEEMSASKSTAKEAFNDAKYGMFIHWGLYSIPGGIWKGKKMEELKGPRVAEWIQFGAQIPRDEYAQLASQFNPQDFDANAIAKLAKDAGMKYLVITSKHHDGFAMYNSEVSEYDIIDASPYPRDIVKELYDACKRHGIDFGLYYSHNIDWMDANDCGLSEYLAAGGEMHDRVKRKAGVNTWDPSPNTFSEYLKNKSYPQVEEILTKFPDMTTLWYDYAHYVTPEQSHKFYKMAYDLQPNMLVNSRVGNGLGDFDIPGDNKIPQDHLAITKPWQTVGTTNNSWGYKSYDHDWKSVNELLFWLVEIVSKGGNYMLNIGPTSSGEVPEESIKNLLAVGEWLSINGEAIYNTRKWIVTKEGSTNLVMNGTHDRVSKKDLKFDFTSEDIWFTQKENTIYAISLQYPQEREKVLIKSLNKENIGQVQSLSLLGNASKVSWKQTNDGIEVDLKNKQVSPYGYALKITF